MKRLLVLLLLIFLSEDCFSQIRQDSVKIIPGGIGSQTQDYLFLTPEIKERIARANTIKFPQRELKTSTFGTYALVSSFLKNGDTLNAARYLIETDPYHLIYLGYTDKTLDKLLVRFNLADTHTTRFREKFYSVYDGPKSAVFDTLQTFYFDIQKLKKELDSVPGTMKAGVEKVLHKKDSLHAAWLHGYVMTHGWPSLENGSLYAASLASRDVEYFYDYLIVMEDAFVKGQVPLFLIRKISDNKRCYRDFMTVKRNLAYEHKAFNVSMFLSGESLPSELLSDIMSTMKTNCPIKNFFYVRRSNKNLKEVKDWWIEFGNRFSDYLWDVNLKISDNCPEFRNKENGVAYYTYYLPNDLKRETLTFYIIFENGR